MSVGAAGPRDPESWHYRQVNARLPGLGALSGALSEAVAEGRPVVACTSDVQFSNGLAAFRDAHPERFFQFGISEQNMVSAAAGMATLGLEPYAATFASFLGLLCCEQIRTDVAYSALPVRLVGHHAGISMGFYGTSHHATEDLAIMRSLADLTVIAPADSAQLAAAVRAAGAHDRPIYFRTGRGREPELYAPDAPFRIGEAVVHVEGEDLTLIACGTMAEPSLRAAEALRAEGLSVGMIDMHTVKPLDAEAVLAAAERSARLMTVEEHSILGGLGGAVAEVLAEAGAGTPLVRHGIADQYALIAPPTHLYAHYGLDAAGIARRARAAIEGAAAA